MANGGWEEKNKMDYEYLIDDSLEKISVVKKEKVYQVSCGNKTFDVDVSHISPHVMSIMIDGKLTQVYLARDREKRYIFIKGDRFTVQEPDQMEQVIEQSEGKSNEDSLRIKAPMPGKIIKIDVKVGEEIRKNQTLAVVEAMKMENEIKSSIDGYVKKISASAEDLVDSETIFIELELKE